MGQPLHWYEENADNSPWIKALAELRQRTTREVYCYQHVQAITAPRRPERNMFARRHRQGTEIPTANYEATCMPKLDDSGQRADTNVSHQCHCRAFDLAPFDATFQPVDEAGA